MFFYCHYIQKGFKPEYLANLGLFTRNLFVASMDLELEERNSNNKIRMELLKEQKGYAVVTF